jgi:hypothetical protein
VTQVSNIRMANGELIPDEWFENDMGPNPELAKMRPDGFLDRLIEEIRKALPGGPGRALTSDFRHAGGRR